MAAVRAQTLAERAAVKAGLAQDRARVAVVVREEGRKASGLSWELRYIQIHSPMDVVGGIAIGLG